MKDSATGATKPTAQAPVPNPGYPVQPGEPTAPGPPPSDGSPINALERLLWFHPFTSLYKDGTKKGRGREWLCFYLDLILLLVVYVALLCLIAGIAWKLVYPIPGLFGSTL